MNTAYILTLVFSWMFLSPLPKTAEDMLIGQINLYMTSDREEMYWEVKFDRNVYPNDCAVLYDIRCYAGEICSPEEVQTIQKVLEAYYGSKKFTPDTIIKRL